MCGPMGALLLSILAILATWLLAAGVLVGLGAGARASLGGRRPGDLGDLGETGGVDGFTSCFWLGFAAVIAFLQLWNFVRPIDASAVLAVALLGAAGLLWRRRDVARWLGPLLARRGLLVAWLLVGLWVADRAAGAGDATDSGLYHYPAVAWASHFAVLPGLANLSVAQAMNNSTFLWSALFDVGPWRGRYEHVCNGVLLWAFFLPVLAGLAALLRRAPRPGAPKSSAPSCSCRPC